MDKSLDQWNKSFDKSDRSIDKWNKSFDKSDRSIDNWNKSFDKSETFDRSELTEKSLDRPEISERPMDFEPSITISVQPIELDEEISFAFSIDDEIPFVRFLYPCKVNSY